MTEASVWSEVAVQLPATKAPSLLDLDPHQLERDELRAAGVPNHRIETLYPANLGSILPDLLDRMVQIDNADLVHLCYAEQQVDSILYAREERKLGSNSIENVGVNRQHMEAYLQAAEYDAAYDELKAYLFRRFGNSQFTQGTTDLTLAATKVLWCTHWFQTHLRELKFEYAAVAQALDARVCSILGITSREVGR